METANKGERRGLSWIRRLLVINLGLVALQARSAGFLLSGSGLAVTIHARVALALALGALAQAVVAIVLWRRHDLSGWMARASAGLLLIVVLQIGLGHRRQYWLHVPIGVGLFG